jgi:ubiquinone/menaquinone biosynthesis C-methylase UbiE
MTASTHAISQYQDKSDRLAARLAIHKYSSNSQGWFEWLATHLNVANKDVLEIGAGTGLLWQYVNHETARLTLTDFSSAMVEQLRNVNGARVQQCDATDLPFADGSFDLVIANHMLYHVDSPDAALAQFARVLRPGGQLVVCLNGRDHLEELLVLGEAVGRTSKILHNASITAETAPGFIKRHFVNVEALNSPGDFEVPNPGPVLEYLNSWAEEHISLDQETKAREIINERIQGEGVFRIKKSMILFTAEREQY